MEFEGEAGKSGSAGPAQARLMQPLSVGFLWPSAIRTMNCPGYPKWVRRGRRPSRLMGVLEADGAGADGLYSFGAVSASVNEISAAPPRVPLIDDGVVASLGSCHVHVSSKWAP